MERRDLEKHNALNLFNYSPVPSTESAPFETTGISANSDRPYAAMMFALKWIISELNGLMQ